MHSSVSQKLVEGFIKSKNLDFTPAPLVVTNVYGNRFRVDAAKRVDTGLAFVSSRISWFQGKSYFLSVDEDNGVVTDLTQGSLSDEVKAKIIKQSNGGIKS